MMTLVNYFELPYSVYGETEDDGPSVVWHVPAALCASVESILIPLSHLDPVE